MGNFSMLLLLALLEKRVERARFDVGGGENLCCFESKLHSLVLCVPIALFLLRCMQSRSVFFFRLPREIKYAGGWSLFSFDLERNREMCGKGKERSAV